MEDLASLGDPLASLGLIDPRSGAALPTEDWRPSQNSQAGANAPAGDGGTSEPPRAPDGEPDGAQAGQGTDPQGGSGTTPQTQQGQQPDRVTELEGQVKELQKALEGRESAAPAQTYEARVQQIDREAQLAYQTLVASGLPGGDGQPVAPAVAQAMVMSARNAAVAEARLVAERTAMLPAARSETARRLAEEYSVGQVKIEPTELANEPTVEAMRSRAKTLQEVRRGQAFQGRQQAGTDRAEAPTAVGKIDYGPLSPTDKIRLGLRRGQ